MSPEALDNALYRPITKPANAVSKISPMRLYVVINVPIDKKKKRTDCASSRIHTILINSRNQSLRFR